VVVVEVVAMGYGYSIMGHRLIGVIASTTVSPKR